MTTETYLRFYEQQWGQLMEGGDWTDTPLQDYPNRGVWTTWAISYQTIRDKHEATANLLLLWSFLDCKDLWHGLFVAACRRSKKVASMLLESIGEIANSELAFSWAMPLLSNYSLVETIEESTNYSTHPVVHRWAYHYQGKRSEMKLAELVVVMVGWAAPVRSARDYWAMQCRILPMLRRSLDGCSMAR